MLVPGRSTDPGTSVGDTASTRYRGDEVVNPGGVEVWKDFYVEPEYLAHPARVPTAGR
jgi:hypothetical protein